MVIGLLKTLVGSRNDRLLKQYRKVVAKVGAFEPAMQSLDDAALQAKTAEFKARLSAGESLDDIAAEAFAVVREASVRIMKMRHFDSQLIGGLALHQGKIAEMGTGEGKTLTATLPVYLNALTGKGVHVVTVNDYLAQRDAEWMSKLYNFLGMAVGVNLSQMDHESKKKAYASDITYGTNNEFGFDYLRDNMVQDLDQKVQRGLAYAIVDEVDSILIDEARTPLIISGQADDHTDLYIKMNALPARLERQIGEEKADGTGVEVPGDYWVDEKSHQVYLTEQGHDKAEVILVELGALTDGDSLYAPQNISLMHHVYAALRAHTLYHRDQQYVVQNNEVIIVDEFTGRLMQGRRWGEGLHQAVEAKEKVAIQNENQTLATITFQNYFRMYGKLAGMTGTADTEAYEFKEIYNLETVVIPPNRISQRKDRQDQIFKSSRERYDAVVKDILDCHARSQPVLVGTTSIENSELISHLLNQKKLPHQVLNAKQHAREAEIIAQAGRPQMITIATNMAGRGTDIVLGGNVEKQSALINEDASLSAQEKSSKIQKLQDEWQSLHDLVLNAGGLHIIGTERHESRRIDNQLRGRSGRQGDPGSSRFYLSLDDPLLRIFAGDRLRAVMERLKMPDGEPIEAGMVTRSIESAQRKVEGRNFDIRKQLLEYDDVANDQRKETYRLRNEVLESGDIGELIANLREDVVRDICAIYIPLQSMEEQWDLPGLENILENEWGLNLDLQKWVEAADSVDAEEIVERVLQAAQEAYDAKVALSGRPSFAGFERSVLLYSLDTHWREHLAALDHLRQGINLRGYAQKDPKQEYRREAFELYGELLNVIKNDVVKNIMTVQIRSASELDKASESMNDDLAKLSDLQYQHADPDLEVAGSTGDRGSAIEIIPAPVRTGPKIGRNDPCSCGSGKKYKNCHGALS
ncbi:preprotein translocase subunit SecA [Polynucleobacter paneuropaeus]|jgi:preprotein translocase subunit SecA|uniref:preprotein translocase subunit SecA n=1 Tax=Polynucleobacter paneuropaeus TaxID=2527775 RepID=UPI001BFD3674|nr:preprotein translocase subunit SecA [Polynucleobacter paneuropaeus]MBT8517193.1 preprotein translocase subunit SecA [Polynucleobacter paneuropaeus]MBT8547805.1 preprotein translocase subunit SecA [Polynucleobacter paneuropaeus]MBT8549248.1 preprotein translocase subunit SecA [Polynucleobacter paneuropaeus]MBT8555430.1 preprotein translocase subunit SecA [Polynucleobacter paneuropaeus]MBT8560706.1 preprotein translocase subunit SecA [Polynucleobacter paneuropaeus]